MKQKRNIKINVNMFDDTKLKIIDTKPERDLIHYIWFRMVTLAGKVNRDGELYVSKNISFTPETFAIEFNRGTYQINIALDILMELEMIEIIDGGVYKVKNFSKHQNTRKKSISNKSVSVEKDNIQDKHNNKNENKNQNLSDEDRNSSNVLVNKETPMIDSEKIENVFKENKKDNEDVCEENKPLVSNEPLKEMMTKDIGSNKNNKKRKGKGKSGGRGKNNNDIECLDIYDDSISCLIIKDI